VGAAGADPAHSPLVQTGRQRPHHRDRRQGDRPHTAHGRRPPRLVGCVLGQLDVVREKRAARVQWAAKCSAGFGGHNCALVLGRPD